MPSLRFPFHAARTGRFLWTAIAAPCLLAGAVGTAGVIHGQSAGINQGGSPVIHAPASTDRLPSATGSGDAARIEHMRDAERHRKVVEDTARLVELSNQLKADLDHAPTDQLSVESLRRVAEIEKTARDLKQWMKN